MGLGLGLGLYVSRRTARLICVVLPVVERKLTMRTVAWLGVG